jgi:aminoglycoside phosphotransferase
MRARPRLISHVADIPRRISAKPAQPEFLRALSGHSGAEVALYSDGRNSLVRKTAGTTAGNDRLLRQSAHQRALAAAGQPFPRILREGYDEQGRAFFEMEYIPARSLASVLCEAAPFDMAAVLAALERALGFFQLAAGASLSSDLFHDKLAGIAAAVPKAASLAALLGACDWSGIPASPSHGDMTLENILLCPARGIVFIDCDAAFASSWWLDAAKLRQDTAGHWCMRALYRDQPGSPAWLNARQRMERMDRSLLALIARLEPALAARLPQLTALHLLRTLPYTRDERLIAFTMDRTALLLKDMS